MAEACARKYNIIYVDPPWTYGDTGCRGAAEKQYDTMSMAELVELKSTVRALAARDAVLLMWVTWPMLREGLDLIREWGFTYKTLFVEWIKHTKNRLLFFGSGHYCRSNSEVVLFGTRGRITAYPRVRTESQVLCAEPAAATLPMEPQLLVAPRREHSRKPEEAKRRIVRVFGDLPRVEMFAREPTPGWDVWGNEVRKFTGMRAFLTDARVEDERKRAQDVRADELHADVRVKKRKKK